MLAIVANPTLAFARHHKRHYIQPLTDEEAAIAAAVVAADQGRALELTGGLTFGTLSTAQSRSGGAGVAFDAGLRVDRVAVLAQFAALWWSLPAVPADGTACAGPMASPAGITNRLGAALRYSFDVERAVQTPTFVFRSEGWVEAGVGAQLSSWVGGHDARPDVELGLGVQFGGHGSRTHGGFGVGLHAFVAPPLHDVPAATGADFGAIATIYAEVGG